MKALTARDPFRVGLVAIAAAVVLGVVLVVLSVVPFGTTTYTAVLQHTAGLRVGEDVQVHGVSVGEVTGIELGASDVQVEFTVEEGIDLGSRTTAAVKVATLLGTHYLEVDPRGDGELADATIGRERTSVPYNLQDVLEQGTNAIEELDPALLAEALTAAADVLETSGDDLGPALQGISALSETIIARSDQTGELLRAATGVSDQLSASSDDILGLMEQTTLVVGEITARREAIHTLLVQTRTLADALTALVTETRDDIAPALRDVNAVLRSLNRQDASLTRVLDALGPALRYVANATGSGPYVDLQLQDPSLLPDDGRCKIVGCS